MWMLGGEESEDGDISGLVSNFNIICSDTGDIAKERRVVYLGEEVGSPDGGGADDEQVEKFLHRHLTGLAPRPLLLLGVLVHDTQHLTTQIHGTQYTTPDNTQVHSAQVDNTPSPDKTQYTAHR